MQKNLTNQPDENVYYIFRVIQQKTRICKAYLLVKLTRISNLKRRTAVKHLRLKQYVILKDFSMQGTANVYSELLSHISNMFHVGHHALFLKVRISNRFDNTN